MMSSAQTHHVARTVPGPLPPSQTTASARPLVSAGPVVSARPVETPVRAKGAFPTAESTIQRKPSHHKLEDTPMFQSRLEVGRDYVCRVTTCVLQRLFPPPPAHVRPPLCDYKLRKSHSGLLTLWCWWFGQYVLPPEEATCFHAASPPRMSLADYCQRCAERHIRSLNSTACR